MASIAFAVAPFGMAFGAAASEAGLETWQTAGFSLLVFAGSAQFAAVEILGDGGSVAAAVTAGLLLNLLSIAFGVALADAMPRSGFRITDGSYTAPAEDNGSFWTGPVGGRR